MSAIRRRLIAVITASTVTLVVANVAIVLAPDSISIPDLSGRLWGLPASSTSDYCRKER